MMKRQQDFHAGRGRAFLLATAKLQKHKACRNHISVIGILEPLQFGVFVHVAYFHFELVLSLPVVITTNSWLLLEGISRVGKDRFVCTCQTCGRIRVALL